ncbi:MAG: MBL fold metallo-hydrolase [Eubacteriales bacterium]
MIIKTLVENTSISEEFKNEHGLSLYIKTKNYQLLFDVGKSNLFIENANKLGIDLSEIDAVIISHGHYDHGGGLRNFLRINKKAKIYLNEKVIGDYYSNRGNEKVYIGLDKGIFPNDRFVFVRDYYKINDSLELFSDVKEKYFTPINNKKLFKKDGPNYIQDDFSHEQNLLITEDDKNVLIAGCAHKGILNVIEDVSSKKSNIPNYVISGFHLYNRSTKISEDITKVKQIANYLIETKSKYYTCHCTGLEAYEQLKDEMGDKIEYLSTGSEVIL